MEQQESYIEWYSQSHELKEEIAIAERFLEVMKCVLKTSDAHDQAVRRHLTPEQYVIEDHQTWVITQNNLDIERLPLSKMIRVKTKIVTANRFFITRQFIVEEMDKVIMTIHVQFAAIDFQTRKMVRLNLSVIEDYLDDMALISVPFSRFVLPKDKVPTNTTDIQIQESDIDLNEHVNNLNYLKWGLMILPLTMKNKLLKKIDVKYGSELLKHHEVRMMSYFVNETTVVQQVFNESLKKEAALIKIVFES